MTVTATTICTPRRNSTRPADTRRRRSSSSRAARANPVSTSASRSPRRRTFRINAAITISADGSSISAANCNNAWSIGTLALICPTRRASAGRMRGGACAAVAGIACSRLACAATVSRSDSVQMARASNWAICRCSCRCPPNNAGHAITRAAAPTAATGHPVTTNVSTAAPNPPATRTPTVLLRSAATSRATRDGGRVRRGGTPRTPATSSSTAPPNAPPTAAASSASGSRPVIGTPSQRRCRRNLARQAVSRA